MFLGGACFTQENLKYFEKYKEENTRTENPIIWVGFTVPSFCSSSGQVDHWRVGVDVHLERSVTHLVTASFAVVVFVLLDGLLYTSFHALL